MISRVYIFFSYLVVDRSLRDPNSADTLQPLEKFKNKMVDSSFNLALENLFGMLPLSWTQLIDYGKLWNMEL